MKIILNHMVKNIFEKKLRTSIMLVTIILSTMVLFIGLSLNDILNNTYSTMVKGAYGDGNILMTKEIDNDDPFYHTEDIYTDTIDLNDRVDLINQAGMSKLDGKDVRVSIVGLDVNVAVKMKLIDPIDQDSDFELVDNRVMISARTATNYDLEVGDPFKIDMNEDTYTYTIGAISKPTGLYDSEMDDIMLVASYEPLNEVYGTENLVTSTLLQVDHDQLEDSMATLKNHHTDFSVEQVGQHESAMRDEETIQTTMFIAIVIIVMISAYVILSLSKVIIAERMPTVGTFRSLGATKGMINRLLSMEFLLYGIIGAVIGLILALLGLPIVADRFNEYKEYGLETVIHYQPTYIIIAFVFGALFPLFFGIIQIHRAHKKTLKEIMLNTTHTVQDHSKRAIIMGSILFVSSIGIHFFNTQDKLQLALVSVLFLFIAIVLLMPILLNGISRLLSILFVKTPNGALKLGIKNIANNKFVSSNASMIIVVFLLLLMVGVTGAGIDQYVSKTIQQDFDVFITEPEMDFSNYEDLESIEGVAEVYRQFASGAQYDIQGEQDTFVVYGVEDVEGFDQFYAGVTFYEDAKAHLNALENGVIIDEYQAERYNLEVGDTILLDALDKENRSLHDGDLLEMEVAGTMDSVSLSSNKDIVITSFDYFQDHFVGMFNQIEVKTNDRVSADVVKNNIKHHYLDSEMTVQTFEELLDSQKASVDTLVQGILMIVLLGLVIGLLGISNNLLVSFLERKKEYAVLYAVCMSRAQLISMLFYEMIMTFIAVVIIGLVGGLTMNMVWTRFIYAVGLKIDFSFNYGLYFILCGAVFILLALSTMSVIRKVARLDVLTELRYE